MSILIEAQDLSKRYRLVPGPRPDTLVGRLAQAVRHGARAAGADGDEFWALRDVSFRVSEGETVGIVGHNGAGKSTLLKILSRVTVPTSGRVRLAGRVSSLLEIGTGFHPDLTARQNIFLNGAILGMQRTEIAARFDEIVDFSGIGRFVNEPVKHLSSGMYVRLAFSVAAFLRSDVMIVDEVLAVGDQAFQDKCMASMRTAARGGRTIIFVSHDLDVLAQLAARTLVFDRGRITYDGETGAALRHYLGVRARSLSPRTATTEVAVHRRLRASDSICVQEIGLAPGQPAAIAPGGTVRLELLIEAKASFNALRLLYSINLLAGAAVLTGFTESFAVQPGSTRLEVAIADLRLVPGEYDFTVSLGRGGLLEAQTEYDAYAGFGRLTVNDRMDDGKPFGYWRREWGAVVHGAASIRHLESPT